MESHERLRQKYRRDVLAKPWNDDVSPQHRKHPDCHSGNNKYPHIYATFIEATSHLDNQNMHLLCHSRLILGITLPSLALWLTPRSQAEEDNTTLTDRMASRVSSLRPQSAAKNGHEQ